MKADLSGSSVKTLRPAENQMTPRFKLKPANMELRGIFFSHDSSRTREKKKKTRKNSHTVRFVKRAVIEAAAKLRGKRERD